jgi:hypothetical protein
MAAEGWDEHERQLEPEDRPSAEAYPPAEPRAAEADEVRESAPAATEATDRWVDELTVLTVTLADDPEEVLAREIVPNRPDLLCLDLRLEPADPSEITRALMGWRNRLASGNVSSGAMVHLPRVAAVGRRLEPEQSRMLLDRGVLYFEVHPGTPTDPEGATVLVREALASELDRLGEDRRELPAVEGEVGSVETDEALEDLFAQLRAWPDLEPWESDP